MFLFWGIPALFGSCGLGEPGVAVLWTDRPEFAVYGELFNAGQDKYKIEVTYFESPARELTETSAYPDLVAASWLKSSSTRTLFRPLDNLFKTGGILMTAFYPRLLALGNIDGNQYLIPVSFNIPALVFNHDYGETLSNPFTVDLEEIKARGRAYNSQTGEVYTRMGFSPSWNDSFLFVAATLFNVSFREAAPVGWDPLALEQGMNYIHRWITEANTSIQAEDDFVFKYFYDPPEKLLASGRILFTYMDSSRFFTLMEEQRLGLDFRWIAGKDLIPLDEQNVYIGIFKKAPAREAAAAFIRWFFRAETQRLLLESAKNNRMNETFFGIGGGFSAMRTVTEQIFPQYYRGLLGHMPPETFLSPRNILPRNWMVIKEKVILPYLRERIRSEDRETVRSLERRVADWYRLNRE
jgi:ABC-type glycerol-3-phosphate transport system substrate-binding protein